MRFAAPLVLALALAAPVAALAAVRAAPKPCTLIGAATASKYLRAPAKGYSSRAHDGGTVCLYIASTGRLQIDDGPRSLWAPDNPSLDPPGTVIEKEPVLGENGALVYNASKKYRFANASFEHGPYEYDVYSQVIPPTGILALAKLVHRKVAG